MGKGDAKVVMKEVPLDSIKLKSRFREEMGNITGLIESIREKGIIQPITIDSNGYLLAGCRRYSAAQTLEMKTIPAIIRPTSDEADDREIELYENVFREDFRWDERVRLIAEIDRLNKEKNSDWSLRKTAVLLGLSAGGVSEQLQLAKALDVMPELANEASGVKDAFKILKKMEEAHTTNIMAERQQSRMAKSEYDFIKTANANYRIGDMFKGLEELKSNGVVHFIECDPPYAVALNEMKKVEGPTSTVDSYQEIPIEEYSEFMKDLCEETYRVAGPNCWMIMWYGPSNHELVRRACIDAGWTVGEIPAIWAKPSGQTMQPSTNLANCYEPFFVCRKGSPVLSKQGRNNVFMFTPTAGQKKYHPTERPLAMMREILNTFVHVGGVVLVPCLGSGVTLRACYLEGMKCFGWDLNGEYKNKFLLAVEADLAQLNGDKGDDDDTDAE